MRQGALIALALAAACGLSSPAWSRQVESRPQWRGPAHFWKGTCGYCHGGEAHVPELRGMKLPPKLVMRFVRDGAPGMPPFHASEIDDTHLQQLAEWVSTQPAPEKQP